MFEALVKQVEQGELYKDPDLTLRRLAKKLNMRDKELSGVINGYSGSNFYHFINGFRVGHFKDLIEGGQHGHLTIAGMALEAGFKTKSTFYKEFKRLEGMTPKQFEASVLNG